MKSFFVAALINPAIQLAPCKQLLGASGFDAASDHQTG
jgi:hypothetical protein